MKCPRCQDKLEKRDIEEVQIDTCENCKGMWFDQDQLRQAKDRTDSDLNWMDFDLWKHKDRFRVAAKPIKCPKCNISMAAIDYDQTRVEVDCCPLCKGVWLDGGEFRKIIGALVEELETKTLPDYIKTSLEQAGELIVGTENPISEWSDFLTVMRMLQYRILAENPKLHDAITKVQTTTPIR